MSDQASPLWQARATIPSITVDYTIVPVAELIDACAGGEAAAWQEFMRRFHRIIAITASRVARRWGEQSPQTVEDLIQDTYLKLCADRARLLREFQFDHQDALFGFLKVVTANVANDHFKGAHAAKRRGGQSADPLEETVHSGSREGPPGLTDAERALLAEQVDACIRDMAPAETRDRDRTIFWLYYRQGMTAREIACLPSVGLTAKGVESTLHRLTQLVRTHLVGSRKTQRSATEGI
jgi:RNA polymerase sigma-70 factor (ECF subfamily)